MDCWPKFSIEGPEMTNQYKTNKCAFGLESAEPIHATQKKPVRAEARILAIPAARKIPDRNVILVGSASCWRRLRDREMNRDMVFKEPLFGNSHRVNTICIQAHAVAVANASANAETVSRPLKIPPRGFDLLAAILPKRLNIS